MCTITQRYFIGVFVGLGVELSGYIMCVFIVQRLSDPSSNNKSS